MLLKLITDLVALRKEIKDKDSEAKNALILGYNFKNRFRRESDDYNRQYQRAVESRTELKQRETELVHKIHAKYHLYL